MKLHSIKIFLILIFIFGFFVSSKAVFADEKPSLSCGSVKYANDKGNFTCGCASGWVNFSFDGDSYGCCGWVVDVEGKNRCFSSPNPDEDKPPIEITEGLTNATFDALNPLKLFGSTSTDDLSTPGGIISRLLNFLFPLAGLILFLLISWGGFEILLNSASQKGMEAGKNRITAAIIGFILLLSSYWLAQIVEIIFHIKFL